jgi:hypothetical protein
MGAGNLQIIGESRDKLRLSCEVCGSHVLQDRSTIGQSVMCPVCGEYRRIPERRFSNRGHSPERRVVVRC